MNDDIDNAIETAARHTREAAERLRQRPVESPQIVVDAHVVDRRAEDLHELAEHALDEAESET
jgi:hypothetical protein